MTVTDLSLYLRPGAVVLHDEPEVHLNPRLLSALLRAVRRLLERFDAFAILATHSLLPVQETPAQNVVIFDLYEDGSVVSRHPTTQSFGGTLDELEHDVFGTPDADKNFRRLLLPQRGNPEAVKPALNGNLGLGARLALEEDGPE